MIQALIDLLDVCDGDSDCEPEIDLSADDVGEAPGESWREAL